MFQNRYWAKPGKADEVFAWRQHATDVQVQMGLPRGQVFRGAGGDEPDAIAQLAIKPDEEAAIKRTQREHMELFQPVMEHMETIARRYEASVFCETSYDEATRP